MHFSWKKAAIISLLTSTLVAIPFGIAYSKKESDVKKDRIKELEEILLDAKTELKQNNKISSLYDIEELISKININTFPFHNVDEFLESLGISAYSNKIPKIVFEKFEDSDVSGRYKDGVMYTNPDTILLGIREGVIHEYIHSKGKFENQILNEGFVQYLTMNYIGTSIRSYSAEVYLIHNLAYILGYIKNSRNNPKDSELIKEGIKILAKAFNNNSINDIENILASNDETSTLIEKSFKNDELDHLRFLFNIESYLKKKNTGLKEIRSFGIDASVFDYFDIGIGDNNTLKGADRKKLIKEKRLEAIEELETLVEKNPEFESSLHFRIALGNLYLKEKDYEKTVKRLEEVIENKYNIKTNFSNDILRLNLGFAYQKVNQPKKAIENYKKITSKSRHSFMIAKANYLIAQTYLETNEIDKAIKTYETLKNFKPFNEERFVMDYIIKSYYDLGDIYFKKREFDKSMKEFSTLIDLYPGSIEATEAVFKKGEIYEEIDDVENAITNYENLINKWPRFHISSLARIRLAEIFIENDEFDKAANYLSEVLHYHPNTQESDNAMRILDTISPVP